MVHKIERDERSCHYYNIIVVPSLFSSLHPSLSLSLSLSLYTFSLSPFIPLYFLLLSFSRPSPLMFLQNRPVDLASIRTLSS